MTERIERVKDALGMGGDRTDAGPDADRHDVERVEGRPYPDEQYRDEPYGADPVADPVAQPVADPVATGDTWVASDSPAEGGYADTTASDPTTVMATEPPVGMAAGAPATPDTAATGDVADDGHWRDLQARFVDEPEAVTREAAVMVDQAVSRLTQQLAAAGGDGSTESLRHAFRRYREVYRTLTDV